jgi:2-polyprenyl-3-methyl-5-hydroxy-6-metoxy-1,4-benzoquinol methylase
MDLKQHWEKVYNTKQLNEVSWYQPSPKESLQFFQELNIPKNASVIDIGGGDSFLVDHLLELGYSNITVLDISAKAINKAKERLGSKATLVKWIVSDVLDFNNEIKYDCWHDRAAFHFLTTTAEIENYITIAQKNLTAKGKLIIGTFSTDGPEKCSGLPVKQYSENLLSNTLEKWFSKIKCITTNHVTPFKTVQNFLFCSFKKLNFN